MPVGNSNSEGTALIGRVFQHKSGGMTAQYVVESLVATSAVIDTYVAAPQGMMIKSFLKVIAPSLTAQPGFSTRFQDAVSGLLKLASPNIIQLFDYGSNEEYFYFVLEYHKSPVLKQQLEEQGTLPIEIAVNAVQGIAGALDLAASLSIYHGLLSPLSIHISKSRGPMITDWNLAQLIGGTRLPRAFTDDPYLAAFVAPEVRGGQPPDKLSDQYNLAATFYTMLSGKVPSGAMINDPAVAQFREPLARALAMNPSERFPDSIAFCRALIGLKNQEAPVASPVTPPTKPPLPPPSPEPAKPAPVMAADRTMIEPPPKPPAEPVRPVAPVAAQAEHTMLEMSVEDLKKAMPDRTMIEPPPKPPAEPVRPAAPAVAEIDRTMPEMSVEEIRREAAKLTPPDRTMIEPPPKPPAESVRPAAPAVAEIDRTMPEMSVEEIRREAAKLTPPAEPARPTAPAAADVEHTMPEMSAEEIRREVEKMGNQAAAPATPPEPARPPAPDVERTMPEISIEELRQAAYAQSLDSAEEDESVDEPGVAEVIDEEVDNIPRRPSGDLPPDLPAKVAPAAKKDDTARPANRTPAQAPAAPSRAEVPPPPWVPQKPERPALDATMPEMPAASLNLPPKPPSRTPGLDATMAEMPAPQFDMPPGSIPPAPYGSNQPGSSVPYNFNTVQGKGGQPAGRQIDYRYKTGTIDRESLEDPDRSSDGLTGLIRSVPPATLRGTSEARRVEPDKPQRRSNPLIWIILAVLLLGVALTIGVVVLKTLHVI